MITELRAGNGRELIVYVNQQQETTGGNYLLPLQKDCNLFISDTVFLYFLGAVKMNFDTDRLSLKVLQVDKAALKHLARIEGETMSVLVRRILRDEFKRRGILEEVENKPKVQSEN